MALASWLILLCVPAIAAEWTPTGPEGGVASGIVLDTTHPDRIVVRTPHAGAYRWDALHQRWVALLQGLAPEDSGLTAVESIALDPSDVNTLYVAAGSPQPFERQSGQVAHPGAYGCCDVLKSTDGGLTWQRTGLNVVMGGGLPDQGAGERLAVDPNDPSIIIYGSGTSGLWRSTDKAAHWQRVSSWTETGPGATPGIGGARALGPDSPGITFVFFDPSTGPAGKPTPAIHVGVAGKGLFVSDDAGLHWRQMPGTPDGMEWPQHAVIGKGVIYMSYRSPHGETAGGSVWRLQQAKWTEITPERGLDYSALAVPPDNPKGLMVAATGGAGQGRIFFSEDSGNSWDEPPANARGPGLARTDVWGLEIAAAVFDPFYPGQLWMVDQNGPWRCRDVKKRPALWQAQREGFRGQTASALTAPAHGAALVGAIADTGLFRHIDVAGPAALPEDAVNFAAITSIDAAGKANVVAAVGHHLDSEGPEDGSTKLTYGPGAGAISRDGGLHWNAFSGLPMRVYGGSIAAGADGRHLVWMPEVTAADRTLSAKLPTFWEARPLATSGALGSSLKPALAPVTVPKQSATQLWVSEDGNDHWRAVLLPLAASPRGLAADRVDPQGFTVVADGGGAVLHSRDGGLSWHRAAGLLVSLEGSTLLPALAAPIAVSVPAHAGGFWLASEAGLFRSDDHGDHFRKAPSVERASALTFGAPAPGHTDAAAYMIGTVNGDTGLFRSLDAGNTWVRLNAPPGLGNTGTLIVADAHIFGRLTLGIPGQGLMTAMIGP